ncbi:uncharacterized protein LOC111058273 isoform X1 [Nilaparvata lugens]|uniref:uncharacterized protein LOC111058273 isoform X1 n=1 Tax=Nilaparvata lugens TaxID=108931 RepID=UPI00193E6B8B|nr:uncharacterized protein LOC111058273 isoform X1 [Nilaparvata lugens]
MILDRLPSFTSFGDYRIRFDMDLQNKFDSIFKAIDEFSKIMKNESTSTVVDIFTVASEIETLFVTMEKNNLVPSFSKKFEQYCKMKGKFPDFEFEFLRNACDHVLTKYLTSPDLSESVVSNSINQYLLHCSSDRLRQLTSNIINTRQAFVELSNFVERNCDPVDVEARIIFDHFCVNFNSDNRNMKMLEKNLIDLLSNNPEEGLNYNILVRILNMNNETAIQASAKKCIVSLIISTRLILKQKQFCIALFDLPCDKLCLILKQYPSILDSIFESISNSLIQHQCSHSGENILWTCDDANLLSYSEIIGIFRVLKTSNSRYEELIRSFIHSRKSGKTSKLIEEIESVIFSRRS